MSTPDVEDGLDQLLGSMNSQIAQKLAQLHAAIARRSEEIQHRLDRAGERRKAQAEAEARRLEAQRTALHEWETANRGRLNSGWEYALDQTVLSGNVSKLDDRSLANAWVIGQQLEGSDPGYAAKLRRAQQAMRDEWDRRHPESNIDMVVDQSANHVTITYADTSIDLNRTLEEFAKANIPVRLLRAEDPESFTRSHPGGFSVDTDLNGSWDGYDADNIEETVLQNAYANLDIGDEIAYLKSADTDEATPADRNAAGIEPAGAGEVERSELRDAAPATTIEKDDDGKFGLHTVELGGGDMFGANDVAEESDLAAAGGVPPATAQLDAHDQQHSLGMAAHSH